jgi:hypothetical protein
MRITNNENNEQRTTRITNNENNEQRENRMTRTRKTKKDINGHATQLIIYRKSSTLELIVVVINVCIIKVQKIT